MQVLLKKDVPHLGQSGDIKNVKNGYARNYLIPRNLVIAADPKTKKEQAFLKQVQERKIAKRKREAEKEVESLKDISVELKARMGHKGKLYGSITNIDIHKALVEKGLDIERKMILLDDPIKTLGVFKVAVKLYKGVHTNIHVVVEDERGDEPTEEGIADSEGTDESAEDASPEDSQKTSDESAEDAPPEDSQESSDEPAEDTPAKAVQESSDEPAEDTPAKAVQESSDEPAEDTPAKAVQESSDEPAEDTPAKAVQESSDEPAEDTPAKAVQESSDEPAEDTPAKAVQESSDETKKKKKTTSQEKQLK